MPTMNHLKIRNQKSSSSNAKGSGVRTFRDLNDEDDDEEDDKTNTNFFTGGEKSGLQVEDPNKDKDNDRSIIDQIFQKPENKCNNQMIDQVLLKMINHHQLNFQAKGSNWVTGMNQVK